MSAALVACSHGTNDLAGRQAISSILADVRVHRPDLAVHETYVDVQHPQIDEVLAAVVAQSPAVVVPMLLSAGYHVKVDIAEAVTGAGAAVASLPLGPDPRIVAVLRERLAEAGVRDEDWVVLAEAFGQGAVMPCTHAPPVDGVRATDPMAWALPTSSTARTIPGGYRRPLKRVTAVPSRLRRHRRRSARAFALRSHRTFRGSCSGTVAPSTAPPPSPSGVLKSRLRRFVLR